MDASVRDVLLASTGWMDQFWDDDAGLIWSVRREQHLVRESVWYALGLLQRAGRGDETRALRAIDGVLAFQYRTPDTPYHGTFRRAPEEADPPHDPVMWVHYDPNWRQFIGTTLAVIRDRFDLPAALRDRVLDSIVLAASSEDPQRVAPTYANIALMKSWLDRWVGQELNEPDRIETGDACARAIAAHFDENDAFLEYNSPTYYGIDLWALALWRDTDGVMGRLGPRLESTLWEDVARFYHADLRNMCGPFDRAYGMDMTRYATPLGLWIWAATDREHAPFPNTSGKFGHPHDFAFGPAIAAHEPHVPADVVRSLHTFAGERTVERTISTDPSRRATAWLGDDAMCGGQTGPTSGIGWFQHAHATMHWQTHDGAVGWARLRADVPADATATRRRLDIEVRTAAPVTFEIYGSSGRASIELDRWELDERTLGFATNAPAVTVTQEGERFVAAYEPDPGGATTFAIRF